MREGWKQVKIGEVCKINKKNINKKFEHNQITYLDISSVGSGEAQFDNLVPIEEAPSRAKRIPSLNDSLIATVRPGNKTYYYLKDFPSNTVISTGFAVLTPSLDKVDSRYLYYIISEDSFISYLVSIEKGANYPAVTAKDIADAIVTLPPLKTQRKIASILSAYDDLIENNLKRIKLLEEQAQLTYEEWFVRFKFPGHETVKFDEETGLPVGWERKKLGELVLLQQGFALNKKSKHHVSEKKTDFPLLKIGDLLNGTETLFVKETIPKQFLVDKDEIIYSRTGQVGLAFMGRKGVIYNNCFRVSANENIDKLVLYYFLISEPIKETAKSLATGSAQPDLNHGAFKSIPIDLPPKNIQKQFSLPIEKNLKIIENLTIQNQHLKEARDILLPRLMSGMIDVDKLDVGSLTYEVNDSLGMVAEENKIYSKE